MLLEKQYSCLGLIKVGRYQADPFNGELISLIGKEPRILKPGLLEEGFLMYKLDLGFGEFLNVYGHNFIYLNEYGVFNPVLYKIRHKNGNFADNRINNLIAELNPDTITKNYTRTVRLSEEIKTAIRNDCKQGMNFVQLAKKYGTSRQTVSLICKE